MKKIYYNQKKTKSIALIIGESTGVDCLKQLIGKRYISISYVICSDKKIGTATLSCCGQEICISCFAKHSRISNMCPFCRTEYAPKVKKPNKLCDITLEAMADNWSNRVWNTGYFHRQRILNNTKPTPDESERHLEWLVRENAKILMKKVKNWYDVEFD